jgi:hypothetical protein
MGAPEVPSRNVRHEQAHVSGARKRANDQREATSEVAPRKRKPRSGAGQVPGSAYVRTARGLGESESRPARLGRVDMEVGAVPM